MANFYNPYMKGPDWGQGLSGLSSSILAMYGAGMFDKKKKETDATADDGAIDPSSVPTTATPEQIVPGAGSGNRPLTALNDLPPNLTPNELKTIMAVLKMAGMGGQVFGGF